MLPYGFRFIETVLCGAYFAVIALWCLGQESNLRRRDFQSLALPTELPRHIRTRQAITSPCDFVLLYETLLGSLTCCTCLFVWRAEALNLPSRDYSCTPTEKALPIYNNKALLSAFATRYVFTSRCSVRKICCTRLHKMHLNSYGDFHSATSCPESKRSLAEPMRAIWLFASLFQYFTVLQRI